MHVIRDESDLQSLTDSEIVQLIQRRIKDSAEYVEHFSELVFFVIVEPGDEISSIEAATGFQVLGNRFDGSIYGAADFSPSWDVLEEHEGCYELVYVLGDDGAGVEIFVVKDDRVPEQLLSMCREYAVPAQEAEDR